MIKKILPVLALSFAFSSLAHAAVQESEIALGGITPGVQAEAMYQIYGQPTRSVSEPRSTISYLYYGNTVEVRLVPGAAFGYANGQPEFDSKYIAYIKTIGNNGFATPAGIRIGIDEKTVYNIYGTPDFTRRNVITYVGIESSHRMDFTIVDGKVSEIKVYKNI